MDTIWCREGLVSSGSPPRVARVVNTPSSPVPSLAEVSKKATSSLSISSTSERLTALGVARSTLFPHTTTGTLAGCFSFSNFVLAALISLRSSQTSLKESLSSILKTSRKMSPGERIHQELKNELIKCMSRI